MPDFAQFQYGGVSFPLPAATTNPLLQDADPAIFYTLDFFKTVLTTYLNQRVQAQIATAPAIVGMTQVVQTVVPFDPAPYLAATQFQFPLLAVYRTTGEFFFQTMSWEAEKGNWAIQYILPPLDAAQMERLGAPLLNAVSKTIHNRIENAFDPSWQSGTRLQVLTGTQEIELVSETFGRYEPGGNLSFPTWAAVLRVKEKAMPQTGAFGHLTAINTEIDLVPGGNQAAVPDFADVNFNNIDPTLLTNLVGFWRSDAGITAGSDATHVGSWANQFGTVSALGPGGPSSQPWIITDGVIVNGVGKPVIRFDGQQTYLTATAADLANDGGRTLVVLFRLADLVKRGSIILQSAAGDIGAKTIGLEANTASSAGGKLGFFANNSSFDLDHPTDPGWRIGIIRLANTTGGGSVVNATIAQLDDGLQHQNLTLKSGAGTWSSMTTANQLVVGGLPAAIATTAAAIDVGIVMAFKASISDADVASVITYCKRWAGLS